MVLPIKAHRSFHCRTMMLDHAAASASIRHDGLSGVGTAMTAATLGPILQLVELDRDQHL